MKHHESWAVFHTDDVIANIFAWCGATSGLKRLGWWTNWSRPGTKKELLENLPVDEDGPPKERFGVPFWDKVKYVGIASGTLFFLGLSALVPVLSAIISPCFLLMSKHYRTQKVPPADWVKSCNDQQGGQLGHASDLGSAGLEYHGMKYYIKWLEERAETVNGVVVQPRE